MKQSLRHAAVLLGSAAILLSASACTPKKPENSGLTPPPSAAQPEEPQAAPSQAAPAPEAQPPQAQQPNPEEQNQQKDQPKTEEELEAEIDAVNGETPDNPDNPKGSAEPQPNKADEKLFTNDKRPVAEQMDDFTSDNATVIDFKPSFTYEEMEEAVTSGDAAKLQKLTEKSASDYEILSAAYRDFTKAKFPKEARKYRSTVGRGAYGLLSQVFEPISKMGKLPKDQQIETVKKAMESYHTCCGDMQAQAPELLKQLH